MCASDSRAELAVSAAPLGLGGRGWGRGGDLLLPSGVSASLGGKALRTGADPAVAEEGLRGQGHRLCPAPIDGGQGQVFEVCFLVCLGSESRQSVLGLERA